MRTSDAPELELMDLRSHQGTRLDFIDSQTNHLVEVGLKATHPPGSYERWPDKGLNRLVAMLDSIDTDELNQVECLEMLIYLSSRRQDARELAKTAIRLYGSLPRVFARPGRELRARLGFDNTTTALIAIAKTSLKYILSKNISPRKQIPSYSALMSYLAFDLRHMEQEILRVVYLDTKCMIIRDEELARGTVDAVPLYPKEVGRRALAYCASSVILAHNHLSDDPTPSRADVEATHKTKGALEFLDIALHDHVIISRRDCYSMKKAGHI